MKSLIIVITILFSYNGFACLKGEEINLDSYSTTLTDNQFNLNNDPSDDIELNERHDQREEGQFVDADEDGVTDTVEEPKKKKTIIKGLIYYLGGGLVLLIIGMIFFIRKKPKRP